MIDPTDILHEFLLRDDPADRTCGEYAEAVSACEVLRTIVTEVELEEVLVLVVVGCTCRHAHVTERNLIVDDFVLHVVKQHGCYVMVAELAVVVQSGLEARRPFGFPMTDRVFRSVVGGALVRVRIRTVLYPVTGIVFPFVFAVVC